MAVVLISGVGGASRTINVGISSCNLYQVVLVHVIFVLKLETLFLAVILIK